MEAVPCPQTVPASSDRAKTPAIKTSAQRRAFPFVNLTDSIPEDIATPPPQIFDRNLAQIIHRPLPGFKRATCGTPLPCAAVASGVWTKFLRTTTGVRHKSGADPWSARDP